MDHRLAIAEVQNLLRSGDPFVRDRLSYGSFIGQRYPYFYMETPKAACTATKVVLWRLEGLGPVPADLTGVHHRAPTDPRKAPLTEEQALEALGGPSVFRFFVWRDPVDRLRSAYWDKICLGYDPSPEWGRWRGWIREAFGLQPDQEITFDHFANYVCAVPDHLRDIHFMSQGRVILADYVPYDHVVRTDDYARGMVKVLNAVGVPTHSWPPLGERRNDTGSRRSVTVSESTAERIRSAYEADYELLDRIAAQPRRRPEPR
jgi:hypothetical protein